MFIFVLSFGVLCVMLGWGIMLRALYRGLKYCVRRVRNEFNVWRGTNMDLY